MEDILSHDLYLYTREKGTIWGYQNEFISAGHLDDLQCAFGCLYGFLGANDSESVPVMASLITKKLDQAQNKVQTLHS